MNARPNAWNGRVRGELATERSFSGGRIGPGALAHRSVAGLEYQGGAGEARGRLTPITRLDWWRRDGDVPSALI
jgi:hypothetical protein